MIKYYCDRCGKEIDGTRWVVGFHESCKHLPLINNIDICGGCYSDFTDWLGEGIMEKLRQVMEY